MFVTLETAVWVQGSVISLFIICLCLCLFFSKTFSCDFFLPKYYSFTYPISHDLLTITIPSFLPSLHLSPPVSLPLSIPISTTHPPHPGRERCAFVYINITCWIHLVLLIGRWVRTSYLRSKACPCRELRLFFYSSLYSFNSSSKVCAL